MNDPHDFGILVGLKFKTKSPMKYADKAYNGGELTDSAWNEKTESIYYIIAFTMDGKRVATASLKFPYEFDQKNWIFYKKEAGSP